MRENVEFVTNPIDILSMITASKEGGLLIGIHSLKLGPYTCLTAVREIILDDEIQIVLFPYDINGHIIGYPTLCLSDIQSVIPFSSKFVNPLLKEINESQINFEF